MNHNRGERASPSNNLSSMKRYFRRTITGLLGLIVLSLLVIASFSGPVAAHTGDDGFHHHDGWMGSHDGWGGWMVGGIGFLWMLLGTLVLVGIPVALVYLLLIRRESIGGRSDDDALALLRRRYAQGEIDEEEFETRRAKLLAEHH